MPSRPIKRNPQMQLKFHCNVNISICAMCIYKTTWSTLNILSLLKGMHQFVDESVFLNDGIRYRQTLIETNNLLHLFCIFLLTSSCDCLWCSRCNTSLRFRFMKYNWNGKHHNNRQKSISTKNLHSVIWSLTL